MIICTIDGSTVKVIDEEGILLDQVYPRCLSSSIPSPRIVHSFKGHELYTVVIHQRHDVKK